LYYDEAGIVQAVGAEALGDNIELQAEEHGWTKAEWQECFATIKNSPLTTVQV